MNLNLFDDMDGLILRERENSLNMQNNNTSIRTENNMDNTGIFPENTPLAMAYVPFQQWGRIYSDDEAFDTGTLFPDLNFPFERGDSNE